MLTLLSDSWTVIATYSEYISRYVHKAALGELRSPGEHHFVAVYLIPLLFSINSRVPDYINPDGTKDVTGDVVYFRDRKHEFGIEVKIGTLRLTARQFNAWIVKEDKNNWPNLFLGVGTRGLVLATWSALRNAYLEAIVSKLSAGAPTMIAAGKYGPFKSIDQLFNHLPKECLFCRSDKPLDQVRGNERFRKALKNHIPKRMVLR